MAPQSRSLVVQVPGPAGPAGVDLNGLLAAALAANPGLRELVIRIPAAPGARAPRPVLTARETEILTFVAQGFTNEQIAECLWLTPDTVKFHLRNAFRRLGAHGRHEAARVAWERHLLPSDQVSEGRTAHPA